ncbi:hypothetical protein [Chelativorans salis]|uniref:Uncharacterized protein n=1 Tax=Chelativorans salis TaxID=2978478 RepID=A0ABT2LWX3_9HYPH|nr:hypothetical protein [Chelativorans sp. EGI FJ00035]MCT7377883.1 hypothetical protein [Chelativorans sp. EGI FJ00035]
MAKLIILTSVLATLGVSNAAAFEAAWGVGPSEANSLPAPRHQMVPSTDSTIVTGSMEQSYGFPTVGGRRVRFSAADGFGPSDENDQPTPRFQIAR